MLIRDQRRLPLRCGSSLGLSPAQNTRQMDRVCKRPVPGGVEHFAGCGTFQGGWRSALEEEHGSNGQGGAQIQAHRAL